MQTRFIHLLAAASIILLASCNNSNSQGKFIPKEAAIVIHIDGKSLSAKLPWEEIKQNPAFKQAYNDSTIPAAMKVLLNNPDSAGIDTKTDMLLFVQKDSSGGYVAFEGTVKDEKLFKTFNKQFTEKATESEKDGVNFISQAPLCIGFTKDKFHVYKNDSIIKNADSKTFEIIDWEWESIAKERQKKIIGYERLEDAHKDIFFHAHIYKPNKNSYQTCEFKARFSYGHLDNIVRV